MGLHDSLLGKTYALEVGISCIGVGVQVKFHRYGHFAKWVQVSCKLK